MGCWDIIKIESIDFGIKYGGIMNFKEVEISNFRSIDNAKLEKLGQVNLIVGKNNSGKTSLLEAMFVLSGMSNPELLLSINAFRSLKLTNDNDFKYIFNNLNIEQSIELKGTINGIQRHATITTYTETTRDIFMTMQEQRFLEPKGSNFPISLNDLWQMDPSRLQNQVKEIEGIKITFQNNSDPEQKVYISIKHNSIRLSNTYKEKLSTRYLNSQIMLANKGIDLSLVVKQKQIKKLVTILKKIEPDLVDIQIVNDNAIYFDIGKKELLPINVMGDGIRRTLAVLSAMYDMEGGVLFIDEVENGLHYSSIKIFWKAILELAKQFDVQIIATTHSYEAVRALKDARQEVQLEKKDNKNEIALYRIEKKDNKTKIIHYDYEDVIISLDNSYEVR